ncbi:MAG: hypothetical protein HYY21_05865 [Candidatus Tectomicrobia bacterium]|nr:hypothetical protein [Candidatus Tectomicrobia bacterium]
MNLESQGLKQVIREGFREYREVEEYKSLRAAFAHLNGQRVTTMTYALTLFGAILGFILRGQPPIPWEYESVTLLVILGAFSLSQLRFSRYACMIAAYIIVHHERDYPVLGYHTRMGRFEPFRKSVYRYNYAVVYTALGLVAVGLPPLVAPGAGTVIAWGLIGAVTAGYFAFNVHMYGNEFPLRTYIVEWEKVRAGEKEKGA